MINNKAQGEYAVKLAIGELAKYDIDVAFPISDNLPFDLVAIKDGKLFKVQIKSSTQSSEDLVIFNLKRSNWWKKTSVNYTRADTDVVIAYDMIDNAFYGFTPDDFEGKTALKVRKREVTSGQSKKCRYAKDCALNSERVEQLFPL